jgi:carboxylesterase
MHQNQLLAKQVTSILGKIKAPLQLLQAKDDDVTSPRNSRFIYDRVASQHKEIILFENSYHIITADQERDKVAQATVSFFNRYRVTGT